MKSNCNNKPCIVTLSQFAYFNVKFRAELILLLCTLHIHKYVIDIYKFRIVKEIILSICYRECNDNIELWSPEMCFTILNIVNNKFKLPQVIWYCCC